MRTLVLDQVQTISTRAAQFLVFEDKMPFFWQSAAPSDREVSLQITVARMKCLNVRLFFFVFVTESLCFIYVIKTSSDFSPAVFPDPVGYGQLHAECT